jgi:cell division protein FtsQ
MARRARAQHPDWRPRAWRAVAWAIVAAVAAWGVGLAVTADWPGRAARAVDAAVLRASVDAGAVVRRVTVEGRVRTDAGALRAALGVEPGIPMLRVDPASAQARITALPWVARARVTRRWPSGVHVALTERRPIALCGGGVIDPAGIIIVQEAPDDLAALPRLSGPGACAGAAALLSLVAAEPDIAARLTGGQRVGDRRWDLLLTGQVRVQLPAEEPGLALAALARAQESQGLLDMPGQRVDARAPGRLITGPLHPEPALP